MKRRKHLADTLAAELRRELNVMHNSINALQGDLAAALFAEMAKVNQARLEEEP